MKLLTLLAFFAGVALQHKPPLELSFDAAAGGYAILDVRMDDGPSPAAAAAVDVLLDGRRDQIILLTPGVNRPAYTALLGPLTAGSHRIQLQPSSLWSWDSSLRISHSTLRVLLPQEEEIEVLAHAPALGLRSDTIGTASDLPLMMYVEDATEGASRWLRYSVIFSHEDGGTPGVALMARWGRTTDIELAYEVELRDGRVVQARYQGPDHRVVQRSRLTEQPPMLLVSTLNNMFLDRGQPSAVVRMVPDLVQLSGRSRESVMDDRPWIYRVMARELSIERPAGVGDPRAYVYVDLKLESRATGIALAARAPDGIMRWSDRGRNDLVVSRQGEMRLAVLHPAVEVLEAIVLRCDPKPEPGQTRETACAVDVRQAFRLGDDYRPGPNLVAPTRAIIEPGMAREIPTTARKIGR